MLEGGGERELAEGEGRERRVETSGREVESA